MLRHRPPMTVLWFCDRCLLISPRHYCWFCPDNQRRPLEEVLEDGSGREGRATVTLEGWEYKHTFLKPTPRGCLKQRKQWETRYHGISEEFLRWNRKGRKCREVYITPGAGWKELGPVVGNIKLQGELERILRSGSKGEAFLLVQAASPFLSPAINAHPHAQSCRHAHAPWTSIGNGSSLPLQLADHWLSEIIITGSIWWVFYCVRSLSTQLTWRPYMKIKKGCILCLLLVANSACFGVTCLYLYYSEPHVKIKYIRRRWLLCYQEPYNMYH